MFLIKNRTYFAFFVIIIFRYKSGEHMKLIDNQFEKLGDDLKREININSKIKIASSIFSMYG